MLINVIFYLLHRTVLVVYFAAIRLPSTAILLLLSRYQLINIPILISANFLFLLAFLLLEESIAYPLMFVLVPVALVSTMMCIHTCKMAIEFRDGNRTDLILKLTVLHNREWKPEHHPLPQGLKVHTLSQGTWLGSVMICAFVLGQFSLLLLADTGTASFWLSVNALLLVSILVDFEMVEHLAAHSRNGTLVKLERKTPVAVILFALEKIRIYLVWPLYYWAPKRYFLTHTHHHHVENNGPADWQSTLRFDLTSIADFSKSLLWLQSSLLFPIDTARYFKALGRHRHFKKLMISSVHNVVVIGAVFIVEPLFAGILFCLYVGMAWVFHSFIFAWHGFHDATKPYDVIASNNSTGHYGHHVKPGTHLFSSELKQIYQEDHLQTEQPFPVHKSNIAFDVISKNWLLMQSLLWQKKYSVIRQLIQAEHLKDEELHQLVRGMSLHRRNTHVQQWDDRLSRTVGAFLEWWLLIIAPKNHRNYIKEALRA